MNEELKLEDAEIAPAPWHITPVAFSDPIITDANHRPVHYTRDILERIVEAVNRVDELGKAILGKLPMSEQFDTFPHLLALMRSDPLYNPHNDPGLVEANKTLRHYADRIEAAAKREREMAKGLSKKLDENRAITGNAAAMREALEAVNAAFDDSLICTDYQMSDAELDRMDEVWRKVKAALDAPARNCDLYATHKAAFEAWYEQSKRSDHWPVPIAEFGIWLLSSPKGGGK